MVSLKIFCSIKATPCSILLKFSSFLLFNWKHFIWKVINNIVKCFNFIFCSWKSVHKEKKMGELFFLFPLPYSSVRFNQQNQIIYLNLMIIYNFYKFILIALWYFSTCAVMPHVKKFEVWNRYGKCCAPLW